MSDLERYLPIFGMICIGVMLIDGITLAGIACIASVVGYFYIRGDS